MLITIRPELHERWSYDTIPSSDYKIVESELAKIGARNKWNNTAGQLMQLPPATYITETATVASCRSALDQIAKTTGRKVSGLIIEGEIVYFHNLKEVPQTIPSLSGWESAAAPYGTLAGLSPSFYEEIFGGL
jgi:hypothetical protein